MNTPEDFEIFGPTPDGHAPMLLVRTGEREFVGYTPGTPPGWIPLAKAGWDKVKPFLGPTQTQRGSARYFEANPVDLKAWEAAGKRTRKDGYNYAIVWAKDGKIDRHMGIREVDPSKVAGKVPVDPASLAVLAAVGSLQASIDELTDMVEQLSADVAAIRHHLELEQMGEVLAMVETIDQDVYESYRRTGTVSLTDWERIAPAEQLFKQQHRQITGELQTYCDTLAFRDYPEAKAATRVNLDRVRMLLALEAYLLRSLNRWNELMLAVKDQRGELTREDVNTARRIHATYTESAHDILHQLRSTDTKMEDRPWYQRLMTRGLVGGMLADRKMRDAAVAHRKSIQRLVRDAPPLEASKAAPLQLVAGDHLSTAS